MLNETNRDQNHDLDLDVLYLSFLFVRNKVDCCPLNQIAKTASPGPVISAAFGKSCKGIECS